MRDGRKLFLIYFLIKNKKLKSKKRTFKIGSNCKYVCTGYNYYNKSTSYTGNNYKVFKKLCKYWMEKEMKKQEHIILFGLK